MNLEQQMDFFKSFYIGANGPLGAMLSRQHDYAPDGVVLLNILDTCVKSDITPVQVLGVLLDKQLTALDHFRKHGHTKSESVRSRCADACNYLVFFVMWSEFKSEILTGWLEHWSGKECTCHAVRRVDAPEDQCKRCLTLLWIVRNEDRS